MKLLVLNTSKRINAHVLKTSVVVVESVEIVVVSKPASAIRSEETNDSEATEALAAF